MNTLPLLQDQLISGASLQALRDEYQDTRLNRILMEQEFVEVDDKEILSTDVCDRWLRIIKSEREKEQKLALQLFRLENDTRYLQALLETDRLK